MDIKSDMSEGAPNFERSMKNIRFNLIRQLVMYSKAHLPLRKSTIGLCFVKL
jgi:hypothetical protein